MFTDLMKQLQVPEKFKRSEKMFWKDPHIAGYLLDAHLDQTHEGASRNTKFIDQSVNFISEIATKKGDKKIIDYGCGPGLYCERLAKRGFNVTGVDFSENSIQYAKDNAIENGLDITYRCENYLHLSDENQYDFATLIYCDYGALSSNDRKQLLQNIWRSLQKGGRLLLDVFTENKYYAFDEGKNWFVRDEGGFWSPEKHLEITHNLRYEDYASLEQTVIITKEEMETYYLWNQYFTKEMILNELEEAGFTLISIYNDVTGEEYDKENDTIALLLEK